MANKTEIALAYAAKGWRVLPIVANNKIPATAHGVKDATTDPVQIRLWFDRNPHYNIGIATGAESGIVVFDIDPRNGGDYSWDNWTDANGHQGIKDTAQQLTAGRGIHYLAQYEPGLKSTKLGPGIDFLADGRYFLVYPSEINGIGYEWEASNDPLDGAEPMSIPPKWIDVMRQSRPSGDRGIASLDLIRGGRNEGLTALGGTLRGYGLSEPEILATLQVTNELRCDPPLPSSDITRIAKSVSRYEINSDVAGDMAIGSQAADKLLGKTDPGKAFFIRATNALMQPSPIPWVIKCWVPEHSTGILYGASGAGKTFVALGMACSVATGRPWLGSQVKPGAVVYLAGEGHYGINKRLKSWAVHNNVTELDDLVISQWAMDLDQTGADLEIINHIKAIVDTKVSLIFIDTLNRHMSGEENSARDMRKFLNVCSVIASAFKATVILVHHTGHGETARERGSSALRASMDVSIHVGGKKDAIKIECVKMKDAPEPDPITVELRAVKTGWIDEDGEEIIGGVIAKTDCEASPEDAPKETSNKIPENARICLLAFREAARKYGVFETPGQDRILGLIIKKCEVKKEDWRSEFYKTKQLNAPEEIMQDSLKKAFARAVKTLEDAGEVKYSAGNDTFDFCSFIAGIDRKIAYMKKHK